ncbi:MAG: hypothetical protein JWN41_1484 [Thermoleophilia bacterium]|nr:hypothetical protein [Thermoleophilia bacterium]
MSSHHVVQDPVASQYADGVDHVWLSWEPSLRQCERLLGTAEGRNVMHGGALAQRFRTAQYRAHLAGEFATGLVPPAFVAASHGQFVDSLTVARDTLSVLAVRAELEELDDETAMIGLMAVDSTRAAFGAVRTSSGEPRAWALADGRAPAWIVPPQPPSKWMNLLMWTLIAVCAALFVALVVEVVLLAPAS